MTLVKHGTHRQYAVLADTKGAGAVSWTTPPLWHRVSSWRGLRPGEGIPDEERLARTLCGDVIPAGFDRRDDSPDDKYCVACERENDRIETAKRTKTP